MTALEDLQALYGRLRSELEAAYAVLPWESARIDRIVRDLLPVERALALEDSRLLSRSWHGFEEDTKSHGSAGAPVGQALQGHGAPSGA